MSHRLNPRKDMIFMVGFHSHLPSCIDHDCDSPQPIICSVTKFPTVLSMTHSPLGLQVTTPFAVPRPPKQDVDDLQAVGAWRFALGYALLTNPLGAAHFKRGVAFSKFMALTAIELVEMKLHMLMCLKINLCGVRMLLCSCLGFQPLRSALFPLCCPSRFREGNGSEADGRPQLRGLGR
jgi:hypothetical protein